MVLGAIQDQKDLKVLKEIQDKKVLKVLLVL
jgi:hypothetical protein